MFLVQPVPSLEINAVYEDLHRTGNPGHPSIYNEEFFAALQLWHTDSTIDSSKVVVPGEIPGLGQVYFSTGLVVRNDSVIGSIGKITTGELKGRTYIATIGGKTLPFAEALQLTRSIARRLIDTLDQKDSFPDLTNPEDFILMARHIHIRDAVIQTRVRFLRNDIHAAHRSAAISWYDVALQIVREYVERKNLWNPLPETLRESVADGVLGRMRYYCPRHEIEYRKKCLESAVHEREKIQEVLDGLKEPIVKMMKAWRGALNIKETKPLIKDALGDDSFGNLFYALQHLVEFKCLTLARPIEYWTYEGLIQYHSENLGRDDVSWYS